MITFPGRVIKKETLKREFNDKFFEEIAVNVSSGWRKAWFYDNEQIAHRARWYEHGNAVVFKLVLPNTACQKSQKGELEVDVKAIKPESIQTVTVENYVSPICYIITNPLIQKDAEIVTVNSQQLK